MNALRKLPRAVTFAIALILLLALIAIPVVRHLRHRVSWAEVLPAMQRPQTIKGVARITGSDDSEWACALWAGREGGGPLTASTLLVPVRIRRDQQPGPDVTMLCQAIDLTGGLGLLKWLADRRTVTAGHTTSWGGHTVLEVELPLPPALAIAHPLWPDTWRLYVDPTSHLVQGLDLSLKGKVVARTEYDYNLPLPKGFRPGERGGVDSGGHR